MMKGSPWSAGVTFLQFPSLTQTVTADVAVVGGGITGVTTAYLLAQAGLSVVVIEKERLGGHATKHTTAFLTQVIDTGLSELSQMFGQEKVKVVLASHRDAINSVEQVIRQENIACEFQRCSNYIYANSEKELRYLRAEEEAGKKLGVPLELKTDDRLGFMNSGYLELKNQAKFHPFKYVGGLVNRLQDQGVLMFENSEVKEMRRGDIVTLTTNEGAVKAKHVVVATYAPLQKKLFFKKVFYTSYVLEAKLPPGSVPAGIYEDTQDPYHYFRVEAGQGDDRIIFGGEDHRSDVPVSKEKSFQALDNHFRDTFRGLSSEIVRHWRGPILESIDGLAWIGRHKEPNIYYATGFSGNGMTYSMITARLITDLIQGRPNTWEAVYNPRRWPTLWQLAYKGRDYAKEMLGGALKNTFTQKKTPH